MSLTKVTNRVLNLQGSGNISSNVAIGENVFTNNTTGCCNVAIGSQTLSTNLTGFGNIAIGNEALLNGNASLNTAVGLSALRNNTTGCCNIAIGPLSLRNNTCGRDNVAIGQCSLGGNTTSSCSVAIGSCARRFGNGSGSVAVGHGAGAVSGGFDVAIGSFAGQSSSGGNVAVGYRSSATDPAGAYNVSVGYSSLDQMGTINGGLTNDYNVAIGAYALESLGTGTDVVTCNNIGIGASAGALYTGQFGPAGIVNLTSTSNRIVMGNNLHTCAQIKIAWSVTSDCRDKTCFKPIPYGLDFVRALKPTEYQFKAGNRESTETDNKRRFGFIAQDILPLEGNDPVIVSVEDPEKLTYTSDHMIPVLVKAIQELANRVEQLENA